jgi:mRNA interferase RelE/StbE
LAWRIEFHPEAEKELSKLDQEPARRILRFLRNRIAPLDNARALGEALKGPEVGRFWKYRMRAYRLICDIQDDRAVVLVVRIGHRRDVYR